MANYIAAMGAKLARRANRWRKSGTPYMDPVHVASVMADSGISVGSLRVSPILDGSAGYRNFYYDITVASEGAEKRYFGSMPDSRLAPFERVLGMWTGFVCEGPIERKIRDFEGLRFLNAYGIPATRPVALDRRTGFMVEEYQDGRNLGKLLESPDHMEGTKIEKCRQTLHIIRFAQDIGRPAGEVFTENFLVDPMTGRVMITDMEMKSALKDPVSHELAAFVYTAAVNLAPDKLLRLARELYSRETVRKIPRYAWRMASITDPLTLYKTTEAANDI